MHFSVRERFHVDTWESSLELASFAHILLLYYCHGRAGTLTPSVRAAYQPCSRLRRVPDNMASWMHSFNKNTWMAVDCFSVSARVPFRVVVAAGRNNG